MIALPDYVVDTIAGQMLPLVLMHTVPFLKKVEAAADHRAVRDLGIHFLVFGGHDFVEADVRMTE